MSKFEHLDTTNEANDVSLDDEKVGLCNGDKEHGDTGSSLSDTEDDLNSSKHDELSDDSMLSDDVILTERARLPSKKSLSITYIIVVLYYSPEIVWLKASEQRQGDSDYQAKTYPTEKGELWL